MTPKIRCSTCHKLYPRRLFHGSEVCVSCRVLEARVAATKLADDVNIDALFEKAKR